MQDVPQIDSCIVPVHVESKFSMEVDFDLVLDCAGSASGKNVITCQICPVCRSQTVMLVHKLHAGDCAACNMFHSFAVFVILCCYLLFGEVTQTTSTISIISYKPETESTSVQQGHTLELWCNVDGYWEYCSFSHVPSGKSCHFEWKSDANNVTVTNCTSFEGRFEYLGEYENYKCGIRIQDFRFEDSGEWRCDIESYTWGGEKGNGYQVRRSFEVKVISNVIKVSNGVAAADEWSFDCPTGYNNYDIGICQDNINESNFFGILLRCEKDDTNFGSLMFIENPGKDLKRHCDRCAKIKMNFSGNETILGNHWRFVECTGHCYREPIQFRELLDEAGQGDTYIIDSDKSAWRIRMTARRTPSE